MGQGDTASFSDSFPCPIPDIFCATAAHRRLMVRAGFVPLLVHMLECTTRPGVAVHAAFIRRAASTILARLANRCTAVTSLLLQPPNELRCTPQSLSGRRCSTGAFEETTFYGQPVHGVWWQRLSLSHCRH